MKLTLAFRLSALLATAVQPSVAHAQIDSTMEALARGAARSVEMFHESCRSTPQAPPLDTPDCEASTRSTSGLSTVVRTGSEISANGYVARLAQARASDQDCALELLGDVGSNDSSFATLASSVEPAIQLLAEETVRNVRLKHRLSSISSRRDRSSDPALLALRESIEKSDASLQTIRNAIPFSETREMATLLSSTVQRMTRSATRLGSLAQTGKIELDPLGSGEFAKELRSGLSALRTSLRNDNAVLKAGVESGGATLSRATRESLAQDRDLIERFLRRDPSARSAYAAMRCQVDATYGRGAEARDQVLFAGSLGLTAASMGAGLAARAILAAAPVRVAAAMGSVSLRASRVLGAGALYFNLVNATNTLTRTCSSSSPQVHSRSTENTTADRCESYKLERVSDWECEVAVALSLLETGAATDRARALTARALGVGRVRAASSTIQLPNGFRFETFGREFYEIRGPNNQLVAEFAVKETSRRLEISHKIAVAEEYRGQGFSRSIIQLALRDRPNVTTFEVNSLVMDNRSAFDRFRSAGRSVEDSIRETPIYKVASREGFTEIVPGSIDMGSLAFVLRRPGGAMPLSRDLAAPAAGAATTLVLTPALQNLLSEDSSLR